MHIHDSQYSSEQCMVTPVRTTEDSAMHGPLQSYTSCPGSSPGIFCNSLDVFGKEPP